MKYRRKCQFCGHTWTVAPLERLERLERACVRLRAGISAEESLPEESREAWLAFAEALVAEAIRLEAADCISRVAEEELRRPLRALEALIQQGCGSLREAS